MTRPIDGSLAHSRTPVPALRRLARVDACASARNREIHGNFEAYLFEATIKRLGSRLSCYTRAESVGQATSRRRASIRAAYSHRHRHLAGRRADDRLPVQLPRTEGRDYCSALAHDVTGYSVPAEPVQDAYVARHLPYHVFVQLLAAQG